MVGSWLLIFLVPGLFIVFGWLWKHGHYPAGRNAFFGYRTALSMQSQEAWDFAQAYSGQVAWRVGWVSLLVSVCCAALIVWKMRRKWYFYLLMIAFCIIQCVGTGVCAILPVENA